MTERPAVRVLEGGFQSLRNADSVIRDLLAREDEAAAARFADYARRKALTALDAAIEIAREPSAARAAVSPDEVRRAEDRLGLTPGTFASCFGRDAAGTGPAPRGALPAQLARIRRGLAAAPVASRPGAAPAWLSVLITITSATVVATAVGAPLSALAIDEPVLAEVVATGIPMTFGARATETTRPILDRPLSNEPDGSR